MDSKYNHIEQEKKIYKLWEDLGVFDPKKALKLRSDQGLLNKKDTFSVLMPPPNANAALHCGHATYAIQDVLIRLKRMQGFNTLYLPGTDHAGFETQVVYERKLKEQGKSRFDYDRKTFYKMVFDFVKENSNVAISQLKRLGMSADWSRSTFMLDPHVVTFVHNTFKKMNDEGYVYRKGYIVNYSTFHGTTFSDLETEYKESISPLYYIKYKFVNCNDYIVVATVRPETIYADVAVAVNPKDKRYESYIGKKVLNPLNNKEIPVIADEYVDVEFGTGVLKITPGHDAHDFEIGQKNNLEIVTVVSLDGKMINTEESINGLYPKQARVKVADILKQKNALDKVDEAYKNRVLVDYKDGLPIEPLVLPNWFIKTEDLFDSVISVVKKGDVQFNKLLWKEEILRWLEQKRPWPISRQTVFGISIPAWYSIKDNPDLYITFLPSSHPESEGTKNEGSISREIISGKISDLLQKYDLSQIKQGLQKIIAPFDAKYVISTDSPGEDFLQETDTFDTWFSSGQWPLTTTGFPESNIFKEYYPTSFLDSMWDIMFFWIARMMLFGLYLTGVVPFKNVYFHGAITDKHGKKMSKSKGNVINPLDFIEKYGADSLRMGILVGGNTSARYSPLDEDKVRGYRNFANKIWNVGRYLDIEIKNSKIKVQDLDKNTILIGNDIDKNILNGLSNLTLNVTKYLEKYEFKFAGDILYDFIWNDFANTYLENTKSREDKETVLKIEFFVYTTCLKLLHPFMPFVTEAIWQELELGNIVVEGSAKYLIISDWPQVS